MMFKVSIIDYLGKYEGGIFVKVGILYENEFYDSLFFYTDDRMILTVSDDLLLKLGNQIENHPEYMDLLNLILSRVEPFENIYDQLDPI